MLAALRLYAVSCLVATCAIMVGMFTLFGQPIGIVAGGGAYLIAGFIVGGVWCALLDAPNSEWSDLAKLFCAGFASSISTALIVSLLFGVFGERHLLGYLAQAAAALGCLIWFLFAHTPLIRAEKADRVEGAGSEA